MTYSLFSQVITLIDKEVLNDVEVSFGYNLTYNNKIVSYIVLM